MRGNILLLVVVVSLLLPFLQMLLLWNCKIIRLPKLLLWYGRDFGSSSVKVAEAALLSLPNDSSIKNELIDCSDYKIEFNDYDWNSNSKV